ncbi:putative E3 ubiquitin-protein ligase ZNRF2 [Scophthalmus maximus]|uniref:RING-type E3 ubiquitin transferase n=1 Tax=Scophthalmus maximus TaxID=52904 RepID=A0A2U9AZY2_SCOMX|nr:putative E3 ubiquitin-protein ligase ZNRF2 [Scophthalmus maximus]
MKPVLTVSMQWFYSENPWAEAAVSSDRVRQSPSCGTFCSISPDRSAMCRPPARSRARSAGHGSGGSGTRPRSGINIPNSRGAYSSPESEGSSPEEAAADRGRTAGEHHGPRLLIGSLPAHLSPNLFGGFRCPVCSKLVSSDEMDLHLVLCLTKPRVTYNEDVLTKDAGECAICLEELAQGDTIARLPCLCIYHKGSAGRLRRRRTWSGREGGPERTMVEDPSSSSLSINVPCCTVAAGRHRDVQTGSRALGPRSSGTPRDPGTLGPRSGRNQPETGRQHHGHFQN